MVRNIGTDFGKTTLGFRSKKLHKFRPGQESGPLHHQLKSQPFFELTQTLEIVW